MKKCLKLYFIFLFSLFLIFISKTAEANSINKLSMDIYVDNSGNALVTEVWDCNTTSGTESYHPYFNLGNSSITNLRVSDGNKQYTTLSSWNTEASFSQKAYKCGLNKTSNGVEICWGISTYANHRYTVQYNINNFIYALNDSQMIYWALIPPQFSNPIENAYVKIHTDSRIEKSIDVWGYGNLGGTAYVYDGYIEMQSNGTLASDEYMTILVKFPSGTFNTTNRLNHDFNHYYKMAEKGATHYNDHFQLSPFNIILIILFILVTIYELNLIKRRYQNFFPGMNSKSNSESDSDFDFGAEGKRISMGTPYYRDIPCDGDLFKAYFIAVQYKLIKNKTDILGAFILKWLKDGIVNVEVAQTGVVIKKESTVIRFHDDKFSLITNDNESKLLKILYYASKDGLLESKEFEKWCTSNFETIFNWFNSILRTTKNNLVTENLITQKETSFLFIKKFKYIATPELKQEAQNLFGLKKYLSNYSLIPDRAPLEVKLFEDYLIFAQMLGIAKQVAKDFKNLYPNLIEESHFSSYDNFDYINTCTTDGMSKASSAESEARSRAEARANDYDAGGGGYSSGGGGSDAFGGGGSGGGFR